MGSSAGCFRGAIVPLVDQICIERDIDILSLYIDIYRYIYSFISLSLSIYIYVYMYIYIGFNPRYTH